MEISLDEAIKHAEEVAEENENVVNTRTFEDGHTVDEMYCDDTECVDAHLTRCAKCAKEHRQLAEWLKDYKRLLEQETEWIPVSERLPENLMVKTLVSCEDVDGLPISTMVALYDAFSKTWDCEYKVIAWMPLPEPYKAESEE